MKPLRSFPMLAFALVLLSVTALCIVQRSIGMLLVAGTLAAISWYITEGPRGKSLPRWVSNILVIAVTLNLLVDLSQNRADLLGVLGRFTVWLTVIKLYERRTARDYAQLLLLSLVLMLTACLQSNDLIYGVLLLIYAALGLYVLLLFQMHAAFEREQRVRASRTLATDRLIPPLKPVTGPHIGWSLRAQTVGIALVGVVMSVLVFVGFPREYGRGMLGSIPLPSLTRTADFTWSIDLNYGGRINDSRDKVMSVQLLDSNNQPMRLDGPVWLRGTALNYYIGGGKWRNTSRGVVRERRLTAGTQSTPLSTESVEPQQFITQRIILSSQPSREQPLFSMYLPYEVQCIAGTPLIYDPATQTTRTESHASRFVVYSVKAAPEPTTDLLMKMANPVNPMTRMNWFSPENRRTLIDLANTKLTAAGVSVDPPEAVEDRWTWNQNVATALMRYLHSPEFTYTTDLSTVVADSPDEDPIVRFLTKNRLGHCEFFASALAALCHVKGIPVRVVVGFVAYDYDEQLQQYNVLARNAHAWTEVVIGPNRWGTFDPTPPATLLAMQSTGGTLADQMRWAFQRLEGNWTTNVADFDESAQAQLAATINRGWAGRLSAAMDAMASWMNRVNRAFYLGPAGYIWMAIVGLAVVIAVIALVKLMRRSLAIRRTLQLQHVRGREYQRMLRQLGFYLDMLRVLRRAGLDKPDWKPPLQHALAVSSRNPEAGELVREITDVFYEARYGRMPLDSQSVHGAGQLVHRLARTLDVKP